MGRCKSLLLYIIGDFMEDLLELIKSFLDILGDDRDDDIQQIIEDGLNDMARVGILTVDETGSYSAAMLADPQIIGCVQLYARYMVNYGGEADRYLKNYTHKRDALSMHGGYYAE